MKKTILIVIAILTFSLTSCNKDEPAPAPELSKTELLTQQTWSHKKKESLVNGNLVNTDVITDDIQLIFNTDNTGKDIDEGIIDVFTWSFSDSENKITITYSGDSDTFDIDKLTSSKFNISKTYTESSIVYKTIFYFEH